MGGQGQEDQTYLVRDNVAVVAPWLVNLVRDETCQMLQDYVPTQRPLQSRFLSRDSECCYSPDTDSLANTLYSVRSIGNTT